MQKRLCKGFKKRLGQPALAATTADHNQSRLFYVKDKLQNLQFLIDTGAQVSIIPASANDKSKPPAALRLQAVNGANISTFGQRLLPLNLGLRRVYKWVFVIADVPTAIIGIDFLRHFGLVVDLKNSVLTDSETTLMVNGIKSQQPSTVPRITVATQVDKKLYQELLQDFPQIVNPLGQKVKRFA